MKNSTHPVPPPSIKRPFFRSSENIWILPEVDRAFKEHRDSWEQLLGRLQVETPDIHTNRMVNIWNAYQVMVTFNFSRSASYFESGIGRGMGFRDSNQDLLGFMHLIPERARERILDLAATQLPDGGAYHQYQPMTKLGNNDIGSGFNDDPLWLVLAVSAYLKETGDWSILDEQVVFDNKPGSQAPLYEHIRRSTPIHPRAARTTRAAVDRAGGLERLPEPELLLGYPRAILPDHHLAGMGRWRKASSLRGCSSWHLGRWR